jgi:hypothetical protein
MCRCVVVVVDVPMRGLLPLQFSDVTLLHNGLWRCSLLASFHLLLLWRNLAVQQCLIKALPFFGGKHTLGEWVNNEPPRAPDAKGDKVLLLTVGLLDDA